MRAPALLLLTACTRQVGILDDGSDSGVEAVDACPLWQPLSNADCTVTRSVDAQADDTDVDTHTTAYSGDADPLTYSFASGTDDAANLDCEYTWLSAGAALTETCSGSATYLYRWLYEGAAPRGRVYDSGSDGTLDKLWAYVLDSEGRITQEIIDSDFDGVPNAMTFHHYDEAGRITRQEWDYDGDSDPDFTRDQVWSEECLLVSISDDRDGNGTIDEETVLTWDASGNLLREEIVIGEDSWTDYWYEDCMPTGHQAVDSDGLTSWMHYTWEGQRKVAEELDWDLDGAIDSDEEWAYDCP